MITLHLGDCAAELAKIPDASIDAIVTDPPAGIGFMGKGWDGAKGGRDGWIAWLAEIMRECLRVLKPGGHALVWALPRTSHWTTTAVEDGGFEIRDVVSHVFGTGFPKSLNIGELGTALKPACEFWILARKPLAGTVAANVLEHGTGAINVDACRVGTSKRVPSSFSERSPQGAFSSSDPNGPGKDPNVGRWPPHLLLTHSAECGARCVAGCPVRVMDEQSLQGGMHGAGSARSGSSNPTRGRSEGPASFFGDTDSGNMYRLGDTGGASRFFPRFRYTAKPSTSEKGGGLDGFRAHTGGEATGRAEGSAGTQNPRAGAGRNGGARNIHPTVKPIELMRWLVRLITPPGGIVLDPFMGSGTTGIAAVNEGASFTGIEREPDYYAIARARIEHAASARAEEATSETPPRPERAQRDLFC